MDATARADTRVAVIGAGMTGIASALELARAGLSVDLYEARDHLGGLSDTYSWDGITWDRFYHVILSADNRLLALIDELGLTQELRWKETRTGFFKNGRLVSMSSIGDFLTFPFLSYWQKFRLGLGILASSRLKNADKLDRIYVREWLTKMFGRRVYERIWDPLLRSKLGAARNTTSAAFMYATISRLYGARDGESKTERMGYVRGGYARILDAARSRLEELGVRIHVDCRVEGVSSRPSEDGGTSTVTVQTGRTGDAYHSALLTVPAPTARSLAAPQHDDGPYWTTMANVHYLGVVCLLVVLDRRASDYYVTNLLDTSLPFTGIVEITNIVDPAEFRDRHLVYLPKYVTSDDPVLSMPDEDISAEFLRGLRAVHPDLPAEAILHTRLFRERYVQPLQGVNYLDQTRGIRTPIPGVYIANTSMLYNCTLNNNAAIGLAQEAAVLIATDAEAPRESDAAPADGRWQRTRSGNAGA